MVRWAFGCNALFGYTLSLFIAKEYDQRWKRWRTTVAIQCNMSAGECPQCFCIRALLAMNPSIWGQTKCRPNKYEDTHRAQRARATHSRVTSKPPRRLRRHPSVEGNFAPQRYVASSPLRRGGTKCRGGLFHGAGLVEYVWTSAVAVCSIRWRIHDAWTAGGGCDTTGCRAGGRIARWAWTVRDVHIILYNRNITGRARSGRRGGKCANRRNCQD